MYWSDIPLVLGIVLIFLCPYIITLGIVLIFGGIFGGISRAVDISINIGWDNYFSGDSDIVECAGCGIEFTYGKYKNLGHSCSFCGSDLISPTGRIAHKRVIGRSIRKAIGRKILGPHL